MRGNRGKRLQRLRSENVATVAYLLEARGTRHTSLRGIDKVRKRYSLAAAAHNLGLLLRGFMMQTAAESTRGSSLSAAEHAKARSGITTTRW
ncbi:MAG: hypothetical protein U0935_12890 [Pirellulales bacterium]